MTLRHHRRIDRGLEHRTTPICHVVVHVNARDLMRVYGIYRNPLHVNQDVNVSVRSRGMFSIPFPLRVFRSGLFSKVVRTHA